MAERCLGMMTLSRKYEEASTRSKSCAPPAPSCPLSTNALSGLTCAPYIGHALYHSTFISPSSLQRYAFEPTYAAGVQKMIYSSGPCYNKPLVCGASADGKTPNSTSVWLQIPIYLLLAMAEILGFTTFSEYSYSEAPKDMRSFVQAIIHG